jgi:predicted N-acyltransferase
MSILALPACKKKEFDIAMASRSVEFTIAEKIDQVIFYWDNLAGNDVFISTEYLRTFEKSPADGITPYYMMIFSEQKPVGIVYFQWKFFRLEENIRNHNESGKSISNTFKKVVIQNVNFPTLICGNLLLTGNHGFVFDKSMPEKEQWTLLDAAIAQITSYLQRKGKPVGLVLVKDFNKSHQEKISGKSFVEFAVQPTMVMKISPSWLSFQDYTDAMKSKYRVRLNKARKEISTFERKVFSASEIQQHKTEIFSLYKNVSNQANFNTFLLHEDYFESIQRALGEQMTFTAYLKDNIIMGFQTTIINQDVLHAHFLGYDKEVNKDCQLYLNMLYDITEQAIQKKKTCIDFSRTAIEIKSSVGAVDVPLFLYIKHVHPVWNKAVSPILNLVKPDTNYTIRHPFREE